MLNHKLDELLLAHLKAPVDVAIYHLGLAGLGDIEAGQARACLDEAQALGGVAR